jgi:hypothetical protein
MMVESVKKNNHFTQLVLIWLDYYVYYYYCNDYYYYYCNDYDYVMFNFNHVMIWIDI